MYLKILIICISFFIAAGISAQETQIKTDTAQPLAIIEDYTNFQLPPLQTLLENIQITNPQVLQSNAEVETAQYDLKIEKKRWLRYLSARAGYTYGILGTYADYETIYNPLTTTYTGSTQHSYSIGANLVIPLDDLLSRNTSVKRQKKIIEQAEYGREIIYNMIKVEVIDLYNSTQSCLAILKQQGETFIIFNANYKVTANNFVNGKATPYDLSVTKNEQTKALADYEATRAKVMTMVMRLEIITGTKIINK